VWHRLFTGLREPSTPAQWQVIAWASILLLLIAGSVGLYYSFHAPPDKIELARQLRNYSLVSYALAACVYGIKKLIAIFVG